MSQPAPRRADCRHCLRLRRARTAASRSRQGSCGTARSGSSVAPAAGRSTRSSTSGGSISTTGSSASSGTALEPARVTGRTFADFDDERVQAEGTEEAGAERRRTRLYLEGVHCAACVWLVEKLPAVLRGVDEVRLNVGSGVAEITWRPAQTRLSAIARALDRLGYTPHVHRASRAQEARRAEDRAGLARLGVAAACAMNLMFLHGALYAGRALRDGDPLRGASSAGSPWPSAAPVLVVLGASVLPGGARRPPGPGRPHRPADRDRPGHRVCGKRVEHGARQRAAVVRLARDARRGPARRPAVAARRAASGPRARRQPARRGVPRVRAAARWRRPRRARRRGPAGRRSPAATGSRCAPAKSFRWTASCSPAARRSTTRS